MARSRKAYVDAAVEGMPEMRRTFRKLDENSKAGVRYTVRLTTSKVLRKAQAGVRVKSGAGRKSLRMGFTKDGYIGRVSHSKRTFYLRFVEFGTVRTKAKPFLLPAAESERGPHAQRMKTAFQRAAVSAAQ